MRLFVLHVARDMLRREHTKILGFSTSTLSLYFPLFVLLFDLIPLPIDRM